MVFWLFKKRKVDENGDTIQGLQKTLKASFANIKQDMGNIGDWIKVLDDKEQEHQKQINALAKRVEALENKVEGVDFVTEEYIEEETEEPAKINGLLTSFQTLTETQKSLFKTLYLLQKEKGGGWVLLKEIANEVYPTKSYNAVRSTISDYLGIIEEMGLAQRKRVSRQSMVSLTDAGKNFVKKIEKEMKSANSKKAKQRKH